MQKIKNKIKIFIKIKEFKKNPYLSLNYQNINLIDKTNLKTSKVTKLQYILSNFNNIKSLKETKFPLETTTYNTHQQLKDSILQQKKNNANFIKIENNIFFSKKFLTHYSVTPFMLYFKLKNLTLHSVKAAKIFKNFFNKDIVSN
jgi:hypothetical protein